MINESIETSILDESIKDSTSIGIVDGIFENKNEFVNLLDKSVVTVENFFKALKDNVRNYYGE